MLSRRTFLRASVASTAVVAAGVGTSKLVARWLQTTTHHVRWPVSRPLTVAHLTDLHLGWGAPESLLSQAVRRCRSCNPDLTVLTGDYLVDSLHLLGQLRTLVRRLPRPCLATLGNHDHVAGADAVQAVFEQEGIPVLRNTAQRLTLRGAGLTVVGLDDGVSGHHDLPSAMASLGEGERAIVLSHQPELVEPVALRGEHLVLAGHTHGGQIHLPLVSALVARRMGHRYLAGWYRVGGARLYVNVGVGCARFRGRVGSRARPELAVFHLLPVGKQRHHG